MLQYSLRLRLFLNRVLLSQRAWISQFLILVSLSWLQSTPTWAYPEMVRHNYVNCTSCHVSPSGGGVLNLYGRALSRELLSQFGKEQESAFAYGMVKTPEWLDMGGEFRALGLYQDAPQFVKGRVFPMQTDLEAAANYKKVWIAGTVGYQSVPAGQPAIASLVSRRHYVNYRPTDEISLRAGRFMPVYGINTPDHMTFVKRSLGWTPGSETYNLELAWIGERINVYGTGVFGRPDARDLNREMGAALTSSLSVYDSYKIGISYYYGYNSLGRRHIAGPWGILGFTPRFFLLTELDFQQSISNSDLGTQFGAVNYQRLDYEFVQGFHGFLTQELSRLDFSNLDSLNKIYGIGIQYFPRPHLEFNFSWQIQTNTLTSGYTDFGFLMFHFYL